MQRLSVTECRPFIEYYLPKILNVGLMEPLKEFAEANPGRVGETVRSWYDRMCDGKSIQDALRGASPGFPLCIQELIAMSAEQGILDFALSDMLRIYEKDAPEEELLKEMGLLVDEYENKPSGDFVCEGCFTREFGKILQRARMERATEVILEQDGERFLHQKYPGVKLTHVIEPAHSKLYKTILQRLKESAETGSQFAISDERYVAKRLGEDRYRLTGGESPLVLYFRRIN